MAFVGAGLLQAVLGGRARSFLSRGGRLLQALRGTLLGLPLPLCSCSVVPVYRGLVLAGAPTAAALAFLVATPELGLDALLLSWSLLGAELTLARLAAAALVALLAGVLVSRFATERTSLPLASAPAPVVPLGRRLSSGLRYGLTSLVDHTGPWIVLGLLLGALIEPLLSPSTLAALPASLEVPALALLGMPAYVCASGATPLVAVLLHKGLSPGAALAFLLTGPASNVTTFALLSALHGRRLALAFAASVALLSVAAGYAVNAAGVVASPPPLHELAAEGPSRLQWASLAVLVLLMLRSLLTQGPRGLLHQIATPHAHAEPAPAPAARPSLAA